MLIWVWIELLAIDEVKEAEVELILSTQTCKVEVLFLRADKESETMKVQKSLDVAVTL